MEIQVKSQYCINNQSFDSIVSLRDYLLKQVEETLGAYVGSMGSLFTPEMKLQVFNGILKNPLKNTDIKDFFLVSHDFAVGEGYNLHDNGVVLLSACYHKNITGFPQTKKMIQKILYPHNLRIVITNQGTVWNLRNSNNWTIAEGIDPYKFLFLLELLAYSNEEDIRLIALDCVKV